MSPGIGDIDTEFCFNVETSAPLAEKEPDALQWLLAETFEPEDYSSASFIARNGVVEAGPRMNFTTAWSTNAVSICHACGLKKITRIERSRRYRIEAEPELGKDEARDFLSEVTTG